MIVQDLNNALKGMPDVWLTFILILFAFIIIVVAFEAPPLMKVLVASWILAP